MELRMPRLLLALTALAGAACRSPEVLDDPQRSAGLPDGNGRDILVTECLNCHELDALELFKDFYNQERWRSLVLTMRENGAQVDDRQVDILAEYLARHFGTGVE
jgi:mono/diheme cytochrome c family protein